LGGGIDCGVEDSCAVKDAEFAEVDGNGREAELGEAGDEAEVLFGSGVAEELESDVPGIGLGPAEVGGWAQTGDQAG
jgi:hypothetical protein